MKKILFSALIVLVAASCGSDNQARLNKLKKQYDQLGAEIAQLEKQIADEAGDSLAPTGTLVAVTEVAKSDFKHYIEVQGKLDGDENVSVNPRTGGEIVRVYVTEGQKVTKGQVLAKIDDQLYQKSLNELQTSLDFATEMYNKQKALWDQKIGSEVQYLNAKNTKESLESRKAQLLEQIDMSLIKSPINGTIEQLNARVGQMANPALPAFRVVNFGKLKVVAEVAESYSSKIRKGDQVLIVFPDIKKEKTATVSFVSNFISPVNRTFEVEARIASNADDLKANMVSYIKINDYHNPNAIAVPVNYVQTDSKGSYVYVAVANSKQYKTEKRMVKTGQSYNGLLEITEGLAQGDKLITSGYLQLENGENIRF